MNSWSGTLPAPDPAPPPGAGNLERLFLVLLTGGAALLAGLSLFWELFWDAAVMHYLAFLVNERGFVPYRDTFDNNMFGVVALHTLAGRVFGYGDFGMRLFDLVWLGALSGCTWAILRRFGGRAAWAGVAAFAWLYLAQEATQLLQRDYLTLLPTALAVLVALQSAGPRRWWRPVLIGALVGIAGTLKPPTLIVLPVLAWYEPPGQGRGPGEPRGRWWGRWLVRQVLAGLGLAIPVALGLGWLHAIGALPSFLRIVGGYYPVYTSHVFDAGIRTATASERRLFILQAALKFHNFGDRLPLLGAAVVVSLARWRMAGLPPASRSALKLVVALAAAEYLQVLIVGNFHPYSWMPLLYFLVLLTALAFARPAPAPRLVPVVAAGALVLALGGFPQRAQRQLAGQAPETWWTARVTDMEGFLGPALREGDRVQPLDHLGGTARVLLRTGATLATPFAEDCFFYHATDQPFVRGLRQDFLRRLRAEPPRFVIRVTELRLHTRDPADPGDFDRGLDDRLTTRYRPAHTGAGYVIYERRNEDPSR